MNQDDFIALGQSRNIQELIRRLEQATSAFDFRYYTVVFAFRRPGESPKFKALCNSPAEFELGSDPGIALIDPVQAKLAVSPFPFEYDQDFYVNAGYGHLWEEAAVHGYKTGLCFAIEIGPGTRFLFGIDRCFALPSSPSTHAELYSKFINLALHTSFASRELLLPSEPILEPPRLSPRERQVLTMSRDGLTAAQVAERLRLQHSTINQYVQSAMAKLGASNKVQAVNMAIAFNLLK